MLDFIAQMALMCVTRKVRKEVEFKVPRLLFDEENLARSCSVMVSTQDSVAGDQGSNVRISGWSEHFTFHFD